MKYTKGEWKARMWVGTGEDYQGVHTDIHTIALCDEDITLPREERESNARLIAAAPKMFNALLDVVVALPCRGTDENNDTCGVTFTCYNCREVNKIKSLLKEAEGK